MIRMPGFPPFGPLEKRKPETARLLRWKTSGFAFMNCGSNPGERQPAAILQRRPALDPLQPGTGADRSPFSLRIEEAQAPKPFALDQDGVARAGNSVQFPARSSNVALNAFNRAAPASKLARLLMIEASM
jgi:hypothetical protein